MACAHHTTLRMRCAAAAVHSQQSPALPRALHRNTLHARRRPPNSHHPRQRCARGNAPSRLLHITAVAWRARTPCTSCPLANGSCEAAGVECGGARAAQDAHPSRARVRMHLSTTMPVRACHPRGSKRTATTRRERAQATQCGGAATPAAAHKAARSTHLPSHLVVHQHLVRAVAVDAGRTLARCRVARCRSRITTCVSTALPHAP